MQENDIEIDGENPFGVLLAEIAKSPQFRKYRYICMAFAAYLQKTAGKKIHISGYDTLACKPLAKDIEYIHRYTETYKNAQYAKFSQLQDWWEDSPTEIHFLTLTGSWKKNTIPEAFEILRDGWRAFSANLREMRKTKDVLEYVWVYEPHPGDHGAGSNLGYPHMHIIIFGSLTEDEIHRLKMLWSKSYKIGSYKRGCFFDEKRRENEKVNVEHLRAYLLKYVTKTLNVESMTVPHFVFLACCWNFYDRSQWTQKTPKEKANGGYTAVSTGGGAFRLWGASRALTGIMKYQPKKYDATKTGENWIREEKLPDNFPVDLGIVPIFGLDIPISVQLMTDIDIYAGIVARLAKQSACEFLMENEPFIA